jgi:uncharacterized membrane protein
MNSRPPGTARLESMIGIALRAGVILSSTCLATGLLVGLAAGESALARVLLQVGIITLLATPVTRVIISIGEYITERDWAFVTLTTVVLIELLASAIAALAFNRRL